MTLRQRSLPFFGAAMAWWCVAGLSGGAMAESSSTDAGWTMVADFNRSSFHSTLGDAFGTWDRDPKDATQSCRMALDRDQRIGEQGFSLRLDYDVDSPNPAYNGFWMKLPNLSRQKFKTLRLAIRGDSAKGYTRRIKIELKETPQRRAILYLDGITDQWTDMVIPLSAFRDIESLHHFAEFVIVFDERTVTQQVGTIYFEDIALK